MTSTNAKGLDIIPTYIQFYSLEQVDWLIESMGELNYSTTYWEYLKQYWYIGGSYFPEDITSIKPYLDKLSDSDDIMTKLEENIPKSNPSIGFETYKALRTMMSGLESEDDDDVAYFYKDSDGCYQSFIYHSKNDINILWSIVNTGIPNSIYQSILKYDDDVNYVSVFVDLIEKSKIPLKDASLYFKLFRGRMTISTQLSFLAKGGSPQTLMLDDDKEDTMYNVCYTSEGLNAILYNSSKEDIDCLLEFSEKFRNFLVAEMSRCSLNYLNSYQFKRLFECIIDKKYDTYESLRIISNYIFNLFGEDTMLSEYPNSMKLFVNNRSSKLFYSSVIKYLNKNTLPYVPIRLLSGTAIEQYLSRNVINSRSIPILNTDGGCFLDEVLNSVQLNNLIIKKGNIEYIPYLSIDIAEYYMSILI